MNPQLRSGLSIFQAMIQMAYNARREGKEPRRWEINDPGIVALQCCEEVYQVDGLPILERTFFGIPMQLARDDVPTARVRLIVDTKP